MRCLFLNPNETLVFLSKQKCEPQWMLPNKTTHTQTVKNENGRRVIQYKSENERIIQLTVVSNSNSFLLTQIEMETHRKWFLFILINTNRENLIEDRQKRENTIHFFTLSQNHSNESFTAKKK